MSRDEIVMRHAEHIRMAAIDIWRRVGHAVELDDLIQWGTIGAMGAADKFNPARGVKFWTFAARRVRGEMWDGIRDGDHVSRTTRERSTHHRSARDAFFKQEGRAPGPEEIAGEDLARPHDMRVEMGPMLEGSLARRQVDGTAEIDFRIWVSELPREYTERERFILIGRYVLDMTLIEMAHAIGVSEGRVSQILANLLPRLRAAIDTR